MVAIANATPELVAAMQHVGNTDFRSGEMATSALSEADGSGPANPFVYSGPRETPPSAGFVFSDDAGLVGDKFVASARFSMRPYRAVSRRYRVVLWLGRFGRFFVNRVVNRQAQQDIRSLSVAHQGLSHQCPGGVQGGVPCDLPDTPGYIRGPPRGAPRGRATH